MQTAIGIDVHKEKCAAFAEATVKDRELKPHQKEFLERFNDSFKRFDSNMAGMMRLANALEGHDAHILIENSTKSHDVYWMLRDLGLDVVVAHATDLRNITMSTDKNDDNDAMKLAAYMRRRLWGEESEFAECRIPEPRILIDRELCRFDMMLRDILSALKRQIRSHMLIRGWKLTREYADIASPGALRELEYSNNPIFQYDARFANMLLNAIKTVEKTMDERMRHDRTYNLVRSVPGFGVLSACYVASMMGDVKDYGNCRDFASFTGLIPKQYTSADKAKRCGISRRGDPELRRLICQATFVHISHTDGVIKKKYDRLKASGKHHKVALVACANSMARMLYGILSSGTEFRSDPITLTKARSVAESGELEDMMESAETSDSNICETEVRPAR